MLDEREGHPSPQLMIERLGDLVDTRNRNQDSFYQHIDNTNTVLVYTEPLHVQLVSSTWQVVHPAGAAHLTEQELQDNPPSEQPTNLAKDSCGTTPSPTTTSSKYPHQPSASTMIEEDKKFMMNLMVAILIFNSALASHMLQLSSTPDEQHSSKQRPRTAATTPERPHYVTKKTPDAWRIYQQSI
jgi:hypothetical protein